MTSYAGLEANRNSVQVLPACCQQESQEHSFHTLDGQALAHYVPGSAQDAAQRPLLVLVEVCVGSVVILECCDVLLRV